MEPPGGEVGCARQAGPRLRHRRRLRRGRRLRPPRRCVTLPPTFIPRPASCVAAIDAFTPDGAPYQLPVTRPANWMRLREGFNYERSS